MKKMINQNTYEYALRCLIQDHASKITKAKINPPFPLKGRWTSGLVNSVKSDDLKVCFILDSKTKVFPFLYFKIDDDILANRSSPILNFELLKKEEVKIFDEFPKGFLKYNLLVFEVFSDKQIKELKDLLLKEHKRRFRKSCDITIDIVDLPNEISDAEMELEFGNLDD